MCLKYELPLYGLKLHRQTCVGEQEGTTKKLIQIPHLEIVQSKSFAPK